MGNRRDFLKKGAYAAPAIITLAAIPSFASAGSNMPVTNLEKEKYKKRKDKKKKRNKRKKKKNDG